jgi:hypothetical protein
LESGLDFPRSQANGSGYSGQGLFDLSAVEKAGSQQLAKAEGGSVELVVPSSDWGPGQDIEFTLQGGSTVGVPVFKPPWRRWPDFSREDEF